MSSFSDISRGAAGLAVLVSVLAAEPGAATAASGPEVQDGSTVGTSEDRIRALEEEVRRLREELERLRASGTPDPRVADLERQVEVLGEELERRRLGRSAIPEANDSRHGLGPAASKVYGIERGVSIGGYGEMLYQDFDARRDDGSPATAEDELDFLRAVFYFGYKFNRRILFNSEVEYEHASTGADGEVALEFAYLDFLLRDEVNIRAGLLLIPVGFLNELHEPPIFLGARRPDVERVVLPTTWRENGVGVFGDAGPVSYRLYLVNGLDAAGFSAPDGIRGGRQSGSKARATDFALAARVDWTPLPGLLVGASGYSGDSGQGEEIGGDSLDARVSLWDAHVEWRWRGLQSRLLWTEVRVDEAASVNQQNQLVGAESVGERLRGWYAEVGYDVLAHQATEQSLVPFIRYEEFNTQDRVPAGFLADPANDQRLLTAGVAWRPISQVVVKADFQDFRNEAKTGTDRFNVALGFLF